MVPTLYAKSRRLLPIAFPLPLSPHQVTAMRSATWLFSIVARGGDFAQRRLNITRYKFTSPERFGCNLLHISRPKMRPQILMAVFTDTRAKGAVLNIGRSAHIFMYKCVEYYTQGSPTLSNFSKSVCQVSCLYQTESALYFICRKK